MIAQIILWSDLPRTILLTQLQNRAGLRIELGDVRVSWAGRTTIQSLSAALPLDQDPFLTTQEIRIQHASLLSILLNRSITIQVAEVDAPRIFAIEDQSGTWNLDTVASTLSASLGTSTPSSTAHTLTLPRLSISDGTLTVARQAHTPISIPFSINGSSTAPHVWTLAAEADTLRVNGRLMTASPWIHDLSIAAESPPALARSLLPDLDIPSTLDLGWKGSLAPPGQRTGTTLHASLHVRSMQNAKDHLRGHATLVASADQLTLTPHNLTLTRSGDTRSPLSISRGSLTLTRDALSANDLVADHAGHRLTLSRGSVDLVQRAATATIAWQTNDPQTSDPQTNAQQARAASSPIAADLTHRGEATLQAAFPAHGPRTLGARFSSDGLALGHRWSAQGDLYLEQPTGQDPAATLTLTNLGITPPVDAALAPSGIVLDGLTLGARLTRSDSSDPTLELVSTRVPGARATQLDAAYHPATRRWNASIHATDLEPHIIAPDLPALLPSDDDLRELATQPISLIASASGRDPLGPAPLTDLSLDLQLATLHVHLATDGNPSRSATDASHPATHPTSTSPDPTTIPTTTTTTHTSHPDTRRAALRLTLAEDPAAPAALVALTDLTGPLDAIFDLQLVPSPGSAGSPTLLAVGSLTAHAPRVPTLATILTPPPQPTSPSPLVPWHIPLTLELNRSEAILTTPGLAWNEATLDLHARHDIATNTQTATLHIDALDLRALLLELAPNPAPDDTPLPRGTLELSLHARATNLNTAAAIVEGTLSGTDLSVPIVLSGPEPLHTHTLVASTAHASFTLSQGTFELHDLNLSQPDATLRAAGTLSTNAQPRQHTLSVVADNWPLSLDDAEQTFRLTGNATTSSTPDPSHATFELDLALDRELADPHPLLTLLTTGTLVASPDTAPLIRADRIDASLLGGTITGHAHLPISEPLSSTLALDINALDLDHPIITGLVQALIPPDAASDREHPLKGLLSGTIKLEPSADPRAHTPRHLTAHLTTSGGSVMRLPMDDISLSLYLSDQRHVLDHASFTLAGGTVALWSRLSRHDDERFMHLSVDAQNLSADILAKALDPDAPNAPGLLSLRATLGGYLAPPHRAYGQADIAIAESDLGGLPVIAQLYSLLSLDTPAQTPKGWGNARLRLEGDTLHLTRLYYFNRGTDIIGNGEVRHVFAWPQSQISGVAAAAARPLRDSALPFAGLLDRAFLAASSRAVSVAISGDPTDIKAEVVPLADVQSSLGRLLGEPSIRE